MTIISGFTNPEDVEPKYIVPIFDRMCCCLPKKTRELLRCLIEIPSTEEVVSKIIPGTSYLLVLLCAFTCIEYVCPK